MEIWFLIPVLVLSHSFNPRRQDIPSVNEALATISKIKDDVSIDITDTNFDQHVKNSKDPWFIYFFQPENTKCIFFAPQWKFFAEKVNKESLGLNVGKVDLAHNFKIAKKFKIFTFPTFLYFKDGFAYNYTGNTQSDILSAVHLDHLYLQYDRKCVSNEKDFISEIKRLGRKAINKYPLQTLIGIFSGFALLLYFPSIINRCKKVKKD